MIKGIFFTDIDGTLLDHDTYSFHESMEGIKLLAENRIPLCPVSSKTFDEIRLLADELGLCSPFVFENGCGIAYPLGSDYRVETTGGLQGLRELVPVIEEFSGERVLPLQDLTADEISRLTGLPVERALLSKKRVASLPFILERRNLLSDSEIAELNGNISALGALLTKGGRFNHLIPAEGGKGGAVKKIIEFYRVEKGALATASAGDSYNDLPMLGETDFAYIVRKKDGSFIETTTGAKVTSGIGPAGFT